MNDMHDAKRDGHFRGDGAPLTPSAIAALVEEAQAFGTSSYREWATAYRLIAALADLAARVPVLASENEQLTAMWRDATAALAPLDAVIAELGIEDETTLPVDAIRELKAEFESAEQRLAALEARGVTPAPGSKELAFRLRALVLGKGDRRPLRHERRDEGWIDSLCQAATEAAEAIEAALAAGEPQQEITDAEIEAGYRALPQGFRDGHGDLRPLVRLVIKAAREGGRT